MRVFLIADRQCIAQWDEAEGRPSFAKIRVDVAVALRNRAAACRIWGHPMRQDTKAAIPRMRPGLRGPPGLNRRARGQLPLHGRIFSKPGALRGSWRKDPNADWGPPTRRRVSHQ
jgi:hypothetical protein